MPAPIPDLTVPGTCERYAELITDYMNSQAAEMLPALSVGFGLTGCQSTFGRIGNSNEYPYNNATSVQVCARLKPFRFPPLPYWPLFDQVSRDLQQALYDSVPDLGNGGFWVAWGYRPASEVGQPGPGPAVQSPPRPATSPSPPSPPPSPRRSPRPPFSPNPVDMVTVAPCVSLTLPANMSDPKPDLAVPGTCERLANFIASYLVTNAPELVPALALNFTLTDCITKPGPIGENATQYPFNNATSLQVCGLFKPFNPSPLPSWWTNGVFWTASRGLSAALRDAFPEELGLGGFWVSWGYYPPETVGNAVAKPPSPSALPPSPQPPATLSPPSPAHVGSAPRPPFPPNPAGTITLAPCMRVVFPGNMSATARPDLAVPGTCERYAEVIINHLNDQAAELIPNLAIPFAMTDCKATWGPIGNSTQWPYNNATSVQICGLFKPVPFRPFPTWYTSDVFGQASRTVYNVLRTAFPTELRLGGFWSVWGYSSRIVQGSVP